MDLSDDISSIQPHKISVVIPVYRGELTLADLVAELEPLMQLVCSPAGHRLRVTEVLLVHDNGPDCSAAVIRHLAELYDVVRPLWLSRNFGQHPATLAGMASSGGDWIVTMDEDGQHDPASIPMLLDTAMAARADIVYGRPVNTPPHGPLRNAASRLAKKVVRLFTSGGTDPADYQSFRLVLGEVGRSVAAYAGAGVYLDVALSWVARRVASAPVVVRDHADRPSGYSMRTLFSHFWRMVLSSGTRALRLVSLVGVMVAVGGLLLALYFLISSLFWRVNLPAGWPSLMVVLLVSSGAILFSLGVIAEYVGVAVKTAIGRPLYLIVSDPDHGPLGRRIDVLPGAPRADTASVIDRPAAGLQ